MTQPDEEVMPDFDGVQGIEAEFANAQLENDESAPASKRRTRKPRADRGMPRRTSTKKLADELLNPWAKLARTLSFAMPTVAAVMLANGEKTVDALVGIAGEHPRMLQALRNVSRVGPAADLAETGIQMIIAGAMDTGRIPREHPVAMLLGVTDLYDRVHPEQAMAAQQAQQEGMTNNGMPANPGANGHNFGAAFEPPPFMTATFGA